MINLQLTYENSNILHSPMAIILNDMAGCFDRIRLNLNTITTRRLGVPKEVAISHAKTITGMEHRIRTAFGDSEGTISPSTLLGGSGQGSRGSPSACHSQLLPMLATLEKLTNGQRLSDPTNSN